MTEPQDEEPVLGPAPSRARAAYHRAFIDSPYRYVLRWLLCNEAGRRHDWPVVEQQARAMLDEGVTDPEARWLLTLALTNQGRAEGRAPAKSRSAPNARTCLSLESGSRPGPTRSRGAGPRRGAIGQMGTNRDRVGALAG